MTKGLVSDPIITAIGGSLDRLSQYQRVIGHNVANVDTPGYRSKTVAFESALQAAQNARRSLSLTQTNERHLALSAPSAGRSTVVERQGIAPRVDGNTVDINREMIELVETSLKYNTLSQLVSRRLQLLRAIASESF